MKNTTTTSTKKVVEADVKKPRLTAAEFTKEFKRQWVLVAISVAYVIYGIIFYYLPLVGWIMAFQNFVLQMVLRVQSGLVSTNSSSFSETLRS